MGFKNNQYNDINIQENGGCGGYPSMFLLFLIIFIVQDFYSTTFGKIVFLFLGSGLILSGVIWGFFMIKRKKYKHLTKPITLFILGIVVFAIMKYLRWVFG